MRLHPLFKLLLALGLIGCFLLFVGGGLLVFAASKEAEAQKVAELKRIESSWEAYRAKSALPTNSGYAPKIEAHQSRLQELKAELEANLKEFGVTEAQVVEQEKALMVLNERITTLQGQVDYLRRSLALTTKKVQTIEEQIAIRESKLAEIMAEKERVSAEAEAQKDIVMSYFSLLQTDSESLAPADITSGLKIVLSQDSFTKNLREEMHFTALETTARKVFHDLEQTMSQLQESDLLLSQERAELLKLHTRLAIERDTLAQQHAAQKTLLSTTQGEQSRFEAMLNESRQQMAESSEAIAALKNDVQDIESKLKLLDTRKKTEVSKLSKEKIQELLQETETNFEAGADFTLEEEEKKPFSWPVPPLKITAQFQDHAYAKTFGMAHNAIDIRAAQGTDIHAPAAGYVYKTVDNGLGYSYIILIHKNNLMTVYGHVSSFKVQPGDLVQEGDVIGNTGGTPGTKGAGAMTSGPHLHFEVWEDGVVKNPLGYLPLEELPPEDVPQEYFLKELGSEQKENAVEDQQSEFSGQ